MQISLKFHEPPTSPHLHPPWSSRSTDGAGDCVRSRTGEQGHHMALHQHSFTVCGCLFIAPSPILPQYKPDDLRIYISKNEANVAQCLKPLSLCRCIPSLPMRLGHTDGTLTLGRCLKVILVLSGGLLHVFSKEIRHPH